ncbi:hypothetical protein LJ756_08455 [Arthrobacter sp. zg-Y411]|uniref:hypothetical protein n=1 Tax=Arthrobacter zhangbolii TaxID=2886936 RepID=UPI001D143C59|nr:hypothetical protein [Arthrobacter zhangbolii]MCC3294655.1 hypothetical protein [Arthrobacter zhangbolii]
MARKSVLFTALGLGAAATVWTARRLRMLLAHGAVQMAAGPDPGPAPQPAAAAAAAANDDAPPVTTVTTGDPASNLPARTWVVDNGSDWDGNPGELVILPCNRTARGHESM